MSEFKSAEIIPDEQLSTAVHNDEFDDFPDDFQLEPQRLLHAKDAMDSSLLWRAIANDTLNKVKTYMPEGPIYTAKEIFDKENVSIFQSVLFMDKPDDFLSLLPKNDRPTLNDYLSQKTNNADETIFHAAASLGYLNRMAPLVKDGEKPSLQQLINCRDKHGKSICETALEGGRLKALFDFLPDKDHQAVLDHLITMDNRKIVRDDEGCITDIVPEKTADHLIEIVQSGLPNGAADFNGEKVSLQVLLDTHEQKDGGNTLFHIAAEKGCLKEMASLLPDGEEITTKALLSAKNWQGISVLHVAAKHGCLDQVAALLPEGKELDIETCLKQDKLGNTVFHWAGFGGKLDKMVAVLPKNVQLSKKDVMERCNGANNSIIQAAAHGKQAHLLANLVPKSERPSLQELGKMGRYVGESPIEVVHEECCPLTLLPYVPRKERVPQLTAWLQSDEKDRFYDFQGQNLSVFEAMGDCTLPLLNLYKQEAPDYWKEEPKNLAHHNKIATRISRSLARSISPQMKKRER